MAQPLSVFLLIGQSNMAGRGRLAEVPPLRHPRVFMFRDGAWRAAEEPLHTDKPSMAGVGLGMSFAVELTDGDPAARIGLVACAMGGTALSQWMPGAELYVRAVATARQALTDGAVLRGILWHQGEGDTDQAELAQSYAARFHEFAAQLRADLGAERVPLVVGELGEFLAERTDDAQHFSEVNRQLGELAATLPLCACVSAAGLQDHGDRLHFGAAAMREFGRRYAAAYLTLCRA